MKSQIGGDIVLFETQNPDTAGTLSRRLLERFGVTASVLQNSVRLEHNQGHRFVTSVVEAFPGVVESVSVSKPSLEDVFIRRTGHRFWTEVPGDELKSGLAITAGKGH